LIEQLGLRPGHLKQVAKAAVLEELKRLRKKLGAYALTYFIVRLICFGDGAALVELRERLPLGLLH
jgi:hypothetical protein